MILLPNGEPATSLHETAVERITQRHASPEDPQLKLRFHIADHSLRIARLAFRAALVLRPYENRFALISYDSGLLHDVVHRDSLVDGYKGIPLLEMRRNPDSDGVAEGLSADEAVAELAKVLKDKDYIRQVAQMIKFGTSYHIVNGELTHPYVPRAYDKLGAYMLGKADLLEPLTNKDEIDMVNTSLRIFLERWPDLARHVVDQGLEIGDDTFEALRDEILPAYLEEEHKFMISQMKQLVVDGHMIGASAEQIANFRAMFDLDKFLKAHTKESWPWLKDKESLAERFRLAMVIRPME